MITKSENEKKIKLGLGYNFWLQKFIPADQSLAKSSDMFGRKKSGQQQIKCFLLPALRRSQLRLNVVGKCPS